MPTVPYSPGRTVPSVVARPLLEGIGIGRLHEDGLQPDPRDVDRAERRAVWALGAQQRQRLATHARGAVLAGDLRRVGKRLAQALQVGAQRRLVAGLLQRGDRLLPDDGQDAVGQQGNADDKPGEQEQAAQRRRRVRRATARRRAATDGAGAGGAPSSRACSSAMRARRSAASAAAIEATSASVRSAVRRRISASSSAALRRSTSRCRSATDVRRAPMGVTRSSSPASTAGGPEVTGSASPGDGRARAAWRCRRTRRGQARSAAAARRR